MSRHFPTTSPITRHDAYSTPIIKNDAQLAASCVKKKAITLEALAKLDVLKGEPVLKFDQLERDTVHMLMEYRVLKDGDRITCIGVLESGQEFWMPKSLYNMVNVEAARTPSCTKVRGKVSTSCTSLRSISGAF